MIETLSEVWLKVQQARNVANTLKKDTVQNKNTKCQ